MGDIFRSIGHTLPVCQQLRIFPIQSCTKFFCNRIFSNYILQETNILHEALYRGIHFQIYRTYTSRLPASYRILPIQSCTKIFRNRIFSNYILQATNILHEEALYMYDVSLDSFSDPSDIHFLFAGKLEEFFLYSSYKFFVTEFSATIYCRLLIFCMKHYICMMYRGIHFQIYRTYNFRLPTTDNFHRQCKIFRNIILGI